MHTNLVAVNNTNFLILRRVGSEVRHVLTSSSAQKSQKAAYSREAYTRYKHGGAAIAGPPLGQPTKTGLNKELKPQSLEGDTGNLFVNYVRQKFFREHKA